MIEQIMKELNLRAVNDSQLAAGLVDPDKSTRELEHFIYDYANKKRKGSEKTLYIEPEEIYGQAIHYFTESNEVLEIESRTEKEERRKKFSSASYIPPKKAKEKIKDKPKVEALSIFDFMEE